MSRYTLYGRKPLFGGSMYARLLVILVLLAVGLLVFDAYMANTLLVLKWVLYSVFGIK